MYRVLAMVFLAAVACGCTWDAWNKDFATPSEKLAPPKFHLLTLGMSKADVVSTIGDPDQVISARKKGDDLVETWEYIRVAAVAGPDQIAERYQVVFTNGALSAYDSSGDFRQQISVR